MAVTLGKTVTPRVFVSYRSDEWCRMNFQIARRIFDGAAVTTARKSNAADGNSGILLIDFTGGQYKEFILQLLQQIGYLPGHCKEELQTVHLLPAEYQGAGQSFPAQRSNLFSRFPAHSSGLRS